MTNQRVIDGAAVIELLREVVAEKGADYRYGPRMCMNKDDDGNALCIAGHLYARLGILEDVSSVSSVIGVFGMGEVAHYTVTGDEVTMTVGAVKALQAAQQKQDTFDKEQPFESEDGCAISGTRHTWGSALAAAEQELSA